MNIGGNDGKNMMKFKQTVRESLVKKFIDSVRSQPLDKQTEVLYRLDDDSQIRRLMFVFDIRIEIELDISKISKPHYIP